MEKPFVVLDSIAGVRIGPLAEHLNAYLSVVRGQGYAPGSARIQIQVIAEFSQWLHRKGTDLRELDQNIVERFLDGRRDARSASRGDVATLYRLLQMLRQHGVTQEERRATPSRQGKPTDPEPQPLAGGSPVGSMDASSVPTQSGSAAGRDSR
jgi:hypothetical protein